MLSETPKSRTIRTYMITHPALPDKKVIAFTFKEALEKWELWVKETYNPSPGVDYSNRISFVILLSEEDAII